MEKYYDNLDVEGVLEHLEGVHRYGGYSMAICPFHESFPVRPSLMVWDTGYKCLSCGVKGGLVKLNNLIGNRIVLSRRPTYNPSAYVWDKWLEMFGSYKEIAKFSHNYLKSNPDMGEYLVTRKLDSQITPGMFGYIEGYYTFPVRDKSGEILGIVARASPTIQSDNIRYTVSPKCPMKLYVPDWRAILKNDHIFACYGTLDSWSLYMAGFPAFTGISGQELNAENIPFRKPMFVIPDAKEEKSAIKLRHEMGWRMRIIFIDWPDGCKDIQDVHMKFGLEKVKELISKGVDCAR